MILNKANVFKSLHESIFMKTRQKEGKDHSDKHQVQSFMGKAGVIRGVQTSACKHTPTPISKITIYLNFTSNENSIGFKHSPFWVSSLKFIIHCPPHQGQYEKNQVQAQRQKIKGRKQGGKELYVLQSVKCDQMPTICSRFMYSFLWR